MDRHSRNRPPTALLLAVLLVCTAAAAAQPVNDSCVNALSICSGSTPFSTIGATTEDLPSCGFIGGDIWYVYLAGSTGTLNVSVCDADFDTVLVAYAGYTECVLTELTCNDDSCGFGSSISFPVVPNGVPPLYYIRVGGFSGGTGSGTLVVSGPECGPVSDFCTRAVPICPGATRFSTIGAGVTNGGCPALADIWFLYTPASDGAVTASTCGGAAFDSILAAYSGDCTLASLDVNQLACNDDTCGFQSFITFNTVVGEYYLIRVGGYQGANGIGTLFVTGPDCGRPPNDRCDAAIDVSQGGEVQGTIAGADHDGSSTCIFVNEYERDVWYRFTAAYAAALTVDSCGSRDGYNFDAEISLHTDCPGTVANQIACNDDLMSPCHYEDAMVTADIGANQTVYIRVKYAGSLFGNGRFVIHVSYPPQNDACADAIDVSAGGTFHGSVLHGTPDGSASCGSSNGNEDSWYRFTADCAGALTVDTCGTNDTPGTDDGMDTVLSLHSACPGTIANELACDDDTPACQGAMRNLYDSMVSSSLAAGQTVYIRVSHYNQSLSDGAFALHIAFSGCQCACDFNNDSRLNSQDFFDFITEFFQHAPHADFNHDGTVNSQDYFDFLNCFFLRPPGCQ